FNHNKELIDPFARAINGIIRLRDEHYGYKYGSDLEDLSFDERDSSQFMPKSVVIDPHFEWEDKNFKRIPWEKTIIYETHVKGLTINRKDLPHNIRGKYSALSSKNIIEYFTELGITTIELMPISSFVDERFLIEKGLNNYWGYNPIAFYAPDCRYSSSSCNGEQVKELKKVVNELHIAGFEVILDIVFNHTAEYNHLGPTLSFKGLDNRTYYLLDPKNPRFYLDYTGTGNTINYTHPIVAQMIIDCMRYWALEYHVDGFRLDLATVFSRIDYNRIDFEKSIIGLIRKDPILSGLKIIVEPWDFGPNGFQLGKFGEPFREWNLSYRNLIRRLWRGEMVDIVELEKRLNGSLDIFSSEYRSINYITSHDGFTLEDLVSYNKKHNEDNYLNNKDGEDENYSWNCGSEGESENENVILCRERRKRGMMLTLLLSKGIPMILGGDEINRTQKGNNNAFCQDNEISWYNWILNDRKLKFLNFVKKAIKIRKSIKFNEIKIRYSHNNFIVIDIDEGKYIFLINAKSGKKEEFEFKENYKILLSCDDNVNIKENKIIIDEFSCALLQLSSTH
ncbi:MAG: glycogen debranching protein GlgX, partial [Sulfolobaceae archaeon]